MNPEDQRRRHVETGNVANTPLAERHPLKDISEKQLYL